MDLSMQENEMPQMLSLQMVSDRTALSRSTLYREIDAGRLKAVKIGKSVRITEQSLRNYISALSDYQSR
jgi:excisionase family DNA binding protein